MMSMGCRRSPVVPMMWGFPLLLARARLMFLLARDRKWCQQLETRTADVVRGNNGQKNAIMRHAR